VGTGSHFETRKVPFETFESRGGVDRLTILRKRDNYRKAFDGFDPLKITSYSRADVQRLLADPGIVRNRGKAAGGFLVAVLGRAF